LSPVERDVSILVFLDQALKAPAFGSTRDARRVSILVFLDQALKGAAAWHIRRGFWCFNPCFPGSSAESVVMMLYRDELYKFQSLFSWIKR